MSKTNFSKIETKSNICVSIFCYENKFTFPTYIPDHIFEDSMNVMMINHIMFHVSQNKKDFCESCLECFSSKNVLTKHKEVFLKINGRQAVRLD